MIYMTNNNHSRSTDLTPLLWRAPHREYHLKPVNAQHYFANQMKWDELYALPKNEQKTHLYVCNRCGAEVAWATSKKTGTRYVCDTKSYRYKIGRRGSGFNVYYYPNLLHSKSCTPEVPAGEVCEKVRQYLAEIERFRAEAEQN
jgi:DNA-directed RNA polymerase subunit RPC12/RpoP